MNDPLTSIGASIFLTLITVILGYIARGIVSINREQVEQGLKINSLTINVDEVIKRVDKIHEWRNRLSEAEIANYKELIRELQGKKDV